MAHPFLLPAAPSAPTARFVASFAGAALLSAHSRTQEGLGEGVLQFGVHRP